jgi:hypothetical protein
MGWRQRGFRCEVMLSKVASSDCRLTPGLNSEFDEAGKANQFEESKGFVIDDHAGTEPTSLSDFVNRP